MDERSEQLDEKATRIYILAQADLLAAQRQDGEPLLLESASPGVEHDMSEADVDLPVPRDALQVNWGVNSLFTACR